jgi:ribonuclease P protein component
MLPKNKRVKRVLFPGVFNSGKVLHSVYLTARVVLPAPSSPRAKEPGRFSFVVSKAVAKKATDRNLLRRRGYSVISKMGNLLPPGIVVVFFFKKGSDKITYASLSREIEGVLGKAGLLEK